MHLPNYTPTYQFKIHTINNPRWDFHRTEYALVTWGLILGKRWVAYPTALKWSSQCWRTMTSNVANKQEYLDIRDITHHKVIGCLVWIYKKMLIHSINTALLPWLWPCYFVTTWKLRKHHNYCIRLIKNVLYRYCFRWHETSW